MYVCSILHHTYIHTYIVIYPRRKYVSIYLRTQQSTPIKLSVFLSILRYLKFINHIREAIKCFFGLLAIPSKPARAQFFCSEKSLYVFPSFIASSFSASPLRGERTAIRRDESFFSNSRFVARVAKSDKPRRGGDLHLLLKGCVGPTRVRP